MEESHLEQHLVVGNFGGQIECCVFCMRRTLTYASVMQTSSARTATRRKGKSKQRELRQSFPSLIARLPFDSALRSPGCARTMHRAVLASFIFRTKHHPNPSIFSQQQDAD